MPSAATLFRFTLPSLISLLVMFATYAQNDSLPVVNDLPPAAENYQWVSYRGKANLTDTGGVRSCNFFIVNRIDSIIYLNISTSGMEIMRAVFTPETITYVNKLNYNYYQGNYEPLKHLLKMPLTFELTQAIVNADLPLLEQIPDYAFEYDNYMPVDSTQSFFYHFVWKDLNRVLSIEGNIKKVRIDIPGPTGIRIPERFTEIKIY